MSEHISVFEAVKIQACALIPVVKALEKEIGASELAVSAHADPDAGRALL